MDLDRIIHADARDFLVSLPEETVDLVVTSPPYWGLRDYGESAVTVWGGQPDCKHEWAEEITYRPNASGGKNPKLLSRKGKENFQEYVNYHNRITRSNFCSKCGAWCGQLGLEPHPQMFIDHLVMVSRLVRRVLKKSGSYYLVLGDTYYGGGQGRGYGGKQDYKMELGDWYPKIARGKSDDPWIQPKQLLLIPSRVAVALQEDGWILRNDIIWHKPNHMPSSVKDRLTSSYEHVFHLFRSDARSEYFIVGNQPNPEKQPEKYKLWLELREWWDKGIKHKSEIPEQLLSACSNLDYYYDLDSIRVPHKRDWRFSGGSLCPTKTRPHGTGWATRVGRHDDDRPVPPRMNPLGKNPADVFQSKKEPYLKNNPHLMRLKQNRYVALNPSKPMDLSHPLGKNPSDFWSVNTQPFKQAHFAVFPEQLIEPIIKSSCPIDGLVVDPFCGSGTVGLVAKKLGRHFLIADLNLEYVRMAKKRVSPYMNKKLDFMLGNG